MVTLQERLDRAAELRRQGCNCAKTVMLAFSDVLPADAQGAAEIATGLGGGMGGCRLTCGCLTAMAMIVTAAKSSLPKPALYQEIAAQVEEFKKEFGHTDCQGLKWEAHIPCDTLIFSTITRLHNYLGACAQA